MEYDQQSIVTLIVKYRKGTLNDNEDKDLKAWRLAEPEHEETFQELLNYPDLDERVARYSSLLAALEVRRGVLEEMFFGPLNSQKVGRLRRFRPLLAAAAILIAVTLLSGVLWRVFLNTDKEAVAPVAITPGLKNDVAPGGNKALLTLADGTTIVLDSAHIGALASQGGVRITKLDSGSLSYKISDRIRGQVLYNTISTPRGGQYMVSLPDGSKVWLNAGSTLRYPVAFSDSERLVEVNGEAYFEIAKNKSCPFKVKIRNDTEIRVLGTHFNIMSYEDEQSIKTTLLEGSVRVKNRDKVVLIVPGEQASIDKNEIFVGKVNIESVVAWHRGNFQFYSDNISSVMRQVARWYDVDVTFAAPMNSEVSFTLSRDVPLSQLLAMLEQTGRVQFKVEGKNVTVIPVKK